MVNESLLSQTDVSDAVSMINPIIVNVINAVILLLIGFVVGKFIEKLTFRIFEMVELDKITKKKIKIRNLSKILSKIFGFLVYLLAIIIALNKIGLATTIINTVIILSILVMILFIVFGVNDIFANFFSGVFFRMKRNISVGEIIKIKSQRNTISGKVEKITLLDIRIDTGKEEIVIVPNTLLSKSIITKTRKKTE
jgi:small-conductance mechanosensitive channel